MAAGEAHWHIGIVETHIRLLKNQLSPKADELPDASIDELVEHCVAAKVRRQTFDGYSPSQWWFGTQCAREVEEQGLEENRSSFERQLQFQTVAQTAFGRADAQKTLRVAQYARSRVLRNPTVGQLVRYFRRSEGVGDGRDRGLGGILGLLRLDQNVWILGKIPMVENSSNMVIFSHHHQIQMSCRHLQLQNDNFHSMLLEILSVLHLVSMLFDFVTALDDFSHDQIHIRAHTRSQRTHLAAK